MLRLYNLAKRKKGVSPVIAVVLLIALTVAAAAVIWAITQGLIGGVVSVTITTTDTTSADPGIWQGTVTASESGDVAFRLFNATGSIDGVSTVTTLTGGSEAAFSVTFTGAGGMAGVIGGSYTLEVSVTVDGDVSLETTSVSF